MSGKETAGAEPRAPSPPGGPDWPDPASWAEANSTLSLLCRIHDDSLAKARQQARRIGAALETLDPLLDSLCVPTCPACGDPCCARAKVWLDFRDLLFLHLAGGPIPLHQLRRNLSEPCRFLGKAGCALDRLSRPWVCTWYLCPDQANLLRRMPVERQIEFTQAVKEIKEGRQRMEEEFLGVVF